MATLLVVEDDRKTNDAICEYLKTQATRLSRPMMAGMRYSFSVRTASILLCWTLCCPMSAACPSCTRYGGQAQHPF